MLHTSFRHMSARAGVVAVLALLITTLVATPASAAVITPAAGTSLSAPNIIISAANQAADDIAITYNLAVAAGDVITITLDDSDVPVNCNVVGDTVGFSSLPTITTATPGAPVFAGALSSSSAACTTEGVQDVLTMTAQTAAGILATTINLTDLRYTVGSNPSIGGVQVVVNSNPAFANATIVDVTVTANSPVVLVPPSTASTGISDIVLTELRPGAVPAGTACVTISTAPAATAFDTTATPTVTATGGGAATQGPPPLTPTTESIVVGTASTAAGTYTISGLHLTTGAPMGFVLVDVGTAPLCNDFATNVVIGLVGDNFRLAGANRYATAEQIADLYPCLTPVDVVMARGDNFPDALAASYLAGGRGSPIVLTDPNSIPTETLNVLRQQGVGAVTLVGGTSAISTAVENALMATPARTCAPGNPLTGANITVSRIGGVDRYATAKAIAEFPGLSAGGVAEPGLDASTTSPCGTDVRTAIVASGANFPDALAAGPLAASGVHGSCDPIGGGLPLPLLLTPTGSLSIAAQDALINLGIKQVILMGGPAAVDATTQASIAALNGGIQVVRVQGTTRQETAAALATSVLGSSFVGGFGTSVFTPSSVFIARPDDSPDSLAAGPQAGRLQAPLLLAASTSSLGTVAGTAVSGWQQPTPTMPIVHGFVVGGTAALSDGVRAELVTAMASQTP